MNWAQDNDQWWEPSEYRVVNIQILPQHCRLHRTHNFDIKSVCSCVHRDCNAAVDICAPV